MEKIFLFLFTLSVLSCFAQDENDLPHPQNPPKLINDLTGGHFFTQSQAEALENKLEVYDDSTSNQIAVIIVDDLKGFSPADYAIAIGRKWGVGNKNFNNGVVLLISTGKSDGKRSVFIAPGYGLEGVVTDLLAQSIVNEILIPNLKAGNYYSAVDEATEAIINAAEGRYQAPKGYRNKNKSPWKLLLIVVIIFIIIIIIGANSKGSGGYVSRRGYRGWGLDTWSGSSGGWIGGGGGFGGGSSGGSGFGGGGFGGGGGGGSW